MLALDPPDAVALTVGEAFDRALFTARAPTGTGCLAIWCSASAPRLPDGTVVRGGGKVVKNVAGYDLPKLFTGAHGRARGEHARADVAAAPTAGADGHAGHGVG